MINLTKALVLAFFAMVWISLVIILEVAPEIYDQTLKLPVANRRLLEVAFLIALSGLLVLLGTGVIRGWRWTFWLILVAFLAGILRGFASGLELAGALPSHDPAWYLTFQAAVGLVQFAISVLMVIGYREGGLWGTF